jgi:hypothetical protein
MRIYANCIYTGNTFDKGFLDGYKWEEEKVEMATSWYPVEGVRNRETE